MHCLLHLVVKNTAQAKNRRRVIATTSNTPQMFRIFIPLIAFVLFSCASSNNNGGPCTYDIDTIPATIISIDTTKSQYPEIRITVKTMKGTFDTMYYNSGSRQGDVLQNKDLRTGEYVIGTQFECEHQVRTSGQCNPEIFLVRPTFYK